MKTTRLFSIIGLMAIALSCQELINPGEEEKGKDDNKKLTRRELYSADRLLQEETVTVTSTDWGTSEQKSSALYHYNSDGKLSLMENFDGNGNQIDKAEYTYDNKGRIIRYLYLDMLSTNSSTANITYSAKKIVTELVSLYGGKVTSNNITTETFADEDCKQKIEDIYEKRPTEASIYGMVNTTRWNDNKITGVTYYYTNGADGKMNYKGKEFKSMDASFTKLSARELLDEGTTYTYDCPAGEILLSTCGYRTKTTYLDNELTLILRSESSSWNGDESNKMTSVTERTYDDDGLVLTERSYSGDFVYSDIKYTYTDNVVTKVKVYKSESGDYTSTTTTKSTYMPFPEE